MADQEPASGGNGSGENSNEPQVSILAQYIKDLSVENPSAPQVFSWQVQPGLDVQFNIAVNPAGDDVHEVTLKIEVSARSDNGVHFVVDLSYAGLFGLRNLPDEALQPFLLIEAPRLLFPFARQVIAEAVSNTGFPPLLLDPIDFTVRLHGAAAGAAGPAVPAPDELRAKRAGRRRLRRGLTSKASRAGSQPHEPRPFAWIGRRAYARQPRARARARHAVRPVRRGELRLGRLHHRLANAEHVPGARSPRAPSRRRSSRCSTRRSPTRTAPAFPPASRSPRTRCRCLLPALVVMTVLLEVFAWPATYIISGGFNGVSADKFAFAVMLSQITFPYLMLISLASLAGGILNSLHKFWVAAAAPILLNVAQIVALALLSRP